MRVAKNMDISSKIRKKWCQNITHKGGFDICGLNGY